MNRAFFFESVRQSIFTGRITQKQASGLDTLLDAWEAAYPDEDTRLLAYCLATAYHETAATMQPIAEYGSEARANRLYGPEGKNPSRAKRMGNSNRGDGARYKGRGYVQLTWKKNYRKAGKAIGRDLEGQPDLALIPEHAARILYEGCLGGWFTGKNLSDYITATKTNYKGARYVVNGQDKATMISRYAEKFEDAILKAGTGPEPEYPPDPDIPTQEPKKTPVARPVGFWAWFRSLFQ